VLVALSILFIGILRLNTDLHALKSRSLKISPGLKEVGAATLLAAIWTLGWDRFVSGHDALTYALWMYTFMTVAAVLLARVLRVKLGGVPAISWKSLGLMGLGETIAYLSISWGYSATSLTSVVALISGAFSVPTLILAYFFLKERLERLQVAAIALILVSISIISMNH
jgi:drug/metabolite transporter (DMT)-like permease